MLIARYAKIIMSLVLASFCLLVTFDNMFTLTLLLISAITAKQLFLDLPAIALR